MSLCRVLVMMGYVGLLAAQAVVWGQDAHCTCAGDKRSDWAITYLDNNGVLNGVLSAAINAPGCANVGSAVNVMCAAYDEDYYKCPVCPPDEVAHCPDPDTIATLAKVQRNGADAVKGVDWDGNLPGQFTEPAHEFIF